MPSVTEVAIPCLPSVTEVAIPCSVIEGTHEDPTWRGNFSSDSEEMIIEQYECLQSRYKFEATTGLWECDKYSNHECRYEDCGEFNFSLIKGRSLKELLDGHAVLTGTVSINSDYEEWLEEDEDLTEEHLEELVASFNSNPESWFFDVQEDGRRVLRFRG